MKKLTIAIADDHLMFCEAIGEMLKRCMDVEIAFLVKNGKELLTKIKQNPVDLLLLDLGMPKMNGIEAMRQLRKQDPDLKVIAMSNIDDEAVVMEMLRLGVNGFVLKNHGSAELIQAIREVIDKNYYFNEMMTMVMYRNTRRGNKGIPMLEHNHGLDDIDVSIIELLCQEKTAKEIGDELCMSPRTVEGRRKKMMSKLNLKNQVGLALYAIRYNIVSLRPLFDDWYN